MRKSKVRFLSIVFVFIFLTGCGLNNENSTVANSVISTIVETDTLEEETTVDAELKLIEASCVVEGKLTTVRDMLSVTNNNMSVAKFVEWFTAEYGEDMLFDIFEYAKQGKYSDKLFHTMTGNSLYILVDAFLNDRDYAKLYTKVGKESDFVSLMLAGDLCLAEDGFVLDYFDETGVLSDYISPIILEKTNKADIFLINHEYSASTRGEPLHGKYYTFRAKPERISLLEEMGADIVSLANNHVYDYGAEAFEDTLQGLNDAGIAYIGGGMNYKEAAKPVFFMVNGIKIGYVAASRAEKMRFTPEATNNSSGIVRMYDLENIKNIISSASKQCDFLIAYLHWGTEDSPYFEQYQHDIASTLFEIGADIIVGGHPHVLQGMEYIDGKPVVYSLGDFWFNDETKYTGMLDLQVDIDGIKQMKFIPCIQSGYKTQYIEKEEEQLKLISYLNKLSNGVAIDSFGIIRENDISN